MGHSALPRESSKSPDRVEPRGSRVGASLAGLQVQRQRQRQALALNESQGRQSVWGFVGGSVSLRVGSELKQGLVAHSPFCCLWIRMQKFRLPLHYQVCLHDAMFPTMDDNGLNL